LLEIFFHIHDPTTLDRQGDDVGSQYRSVVFYHSDEQRSAAESVISKLSEEDVWGAPIVTQLLPAPEFYPAESYHDAYFEKNPWQPYCRIVIAPKVAKFRRAFAAE